MTVKVCFLFFLYCLHTARRKTRKVTQVLPTDSLITLTLLVAHLQYRRLSCWAEIFEIVGFFELLVDDLSAKIPPCCFLQLVPRAISGFKMVGGQTGPPEAVYMEVGSS